MALLKRDNVTAPTLRKETVPVASLGGEVIVRGLMLSERMMLREKAHAARESGGGDRFIAELLACAVIDEDGKPLFSAEQWDIWAAANPAEYGALIDKAIDVGGLDGAAAKNG